MEAAFATTSAQPPASAEALWRAWIESGDVAARDRLVLSYAPMVKYLACRKVRELPAHCELDDLVSCGLLALIAAVDRFDPPRARRSSSTPGRACPARSWTSCGARTGLRARSRRSGRAIERARDEWQPRHGRLAVRR